MPLDVQHYPDAYHYEGAKRFGVCPQSIGRVLNKLGVSYKKTLNHPKANKQARARLQSRIKDDQSVGKPIIYIDESSFAHDMPKTHGYTSKGDPLLWQTGLGR